MKTVIFDFDGTLADSLQLIIEIFEQLTGQTTKMSKADIMKLHHLPIPKLAKKLGISWWRVPLLLYHGRDQMRKQINQVILYEGLARAIAELHRANYQLLVVSSNSAHNIRVFLKNNNLDKYFNHIYGGVGLFAKAPALRRVIRRNRTSLEQVVYIGDESRDIEACHSLGLKCIAVEWGFADPKFLARHQPFALVKTADELLAAIKLAIG